MVFKGLCQPKMFYVIRHLWVFLFCSSINVHLMPWQLFLLTTVKKKVVFKSGVLESTQGLIQPWDSQTRSWERGWDGLRLDWDISLQMGLRISAGEGTQGQPEPWNHWAKPWWGSWAAARLGHHLQDGGLHLQWAWPGMVLPELDITLWVM